jgi:hypothetical protein
MNFLQETLRCIKESGHSTEDIVFIGSEKSGHECNFKEFEEMADKEYDNSYGAQEVANDLAIVFSDGSRMYRVEYDGSEWWEYRKPFVKPEVKKSINSLFTKNCGWDSLEDCQ